MRALIRRFQSKSKGKNNAIIIAKNINYKYKVNGNNNHILINSKNCSINKQKINIQIYGSNNSIRIIEPLDILKLNINIGSLDIPINNSTIYIDKGCSFGYTEIWVFNNKSNLYIGKDCMFSQNITIKTGELPHIIYKKDTQELIGQMSNINIGNHCWIGENVIILKNSSIADNNILGCNAVVTKHFDKQFTVIAGNPAIVRKENICWARNKNTLR